MLSGACMCGRIHHEIAGKPRFMYQCRLTAAALARDATAPNGTDFASH